MSDQRYSGSCLCGAVRYAGGGAATNVCYCHCASCRRATGAPFVAWATLVLRLFSFGEAKPAWYKSSPKVSRTFCGSCGTSLTYQHEDRADEIDVTIPTLDDPEQLEPECHTWVSDKLPWLRLEDRLPQHPEWKSS